MVFQEGTEKVALISANIGTFDKPSEPVPQSIPYDRYHFTQHTRFNSLSPRMEARLIKSFAWQMIPEHEYYLWVDSSCKLSDPESIRWFISKCRGDIAVFKHPNRATIQEEADYLKHRLAINCPYITPRYKGEDIDGQLKEVNPEAPLYASTAFIYRLNDSTKAMFKEWWYHITRYHSIDQLSFTQALRGCEVNVIEESYLKIPYLEYLR